MSAKHYLKLTKAAIEKNDGDLALEYVNDVLEDDPDNYFAFIFRGKAYQLLSQINDAIIAFKRAIEIEPTNLLGWKGYWQSVKSSNDFDQFFSVLGQYLTVQKDQSLPLAETLKDFTNYMHSHNFKKNKTLYELYLGSIVPGGCVFDVAGPRFGRAEDNLKKLLDLKLKNLEEEVTKLIAKHRIKLPKTLSFEQQKSVNEVVWPIYKKHEVSVYFDEFLNICNDDERRAEYQEKYLKYKYDLLKTSKDKDSLLKEVKSMCDDLVLLKVPSLFAWTLYFDLLDVKDFQALEADSVAFFISKFPNEGLGVLLYGFVNSDISPFDKAEIMKHIAKYDQKPENKQEKNTQADKEEDTDAELELDEDEATLLSQVDVENEDDSSNETGIPPDQVLSYLSEGLKRCSDSVLANRIVINYYIQLREYVEASEKCTKGIRMLADLQRSIGAYLANSREDVICSLGVVYTYHEVPKNFTRALELYEKILGNNKQNKRARIGKGLILMEKGNLTVAHELLVQVTAEFPDDPDALVELGWCEVLLENFDIGTIHLQKALKFIKGIDPQSCELRAKIHWRISESYTRSDSDHYTKAYDALILSLKEYKNFAPSYTSLGLIYLNKYKDQTRAHKCFYRAFELDVAEVVSARFLVDEITAKKEWDVAEILCTRVVETERSRRALSSQSDKVWPYRVLGCSALNKQDDGKAVEWFQTALRMASMDFECWVGLGEAYYNCGRLDASQKVFRKALSIKSDAWHVILLLGKALCDVKEFEEGIQHLEAALTSRPNEEYIINALFQCKLDYMDKLISNGQFSRAMMVNKEAISLISKYSEININSQSLWISLNRALQLSLKVQQDLSSFPIQDTKKIFDKVDIQTVDDLVTDLETVHKLSFEDCLELYQKEQYIESISEILILCFKCCCNLMANDSRYIKSINYYNLGLAYLECYNMRQQENHRVCAIKCFKKSIQLEAKNPQFWMALGNSYIDFSPLISQHCFIKASALESRDAVIWNNLAALYLKYGDTELAQEAFLRSQSVAPEQSQPWLGHALTARAAGQQDKAANLFTHAYILANGKSPLAQLLYGLSVIDKRISLNESISDPNDIETAQEFSIANFAVQNYLKFYPNDTLGLKVALTISERCKTFDLSAKIGQKLCSLLEAEYEASESEASLQKFISAKAQLARIHLATKEFDSAIEVSEMIIDIIEGDETEPSATNKKNLLSCRIVIGLTYFFQNNLEKSIQQLKLILNEYNQSESLVTLTVQILNAFDTETTKKAALDQLFSFIEDNDTQTSLIIVLTLGAISLKDDLEDILPAVKDELLRLPLVSIVKDSRKHIPKLIEQINTKLGVNQSHLWQRNAILFPHDYNIWCNINSQMALKIAHLATTKINSFDMSSAYIAEGTVRNIQRGLLLSPHNQLGWDTLAQKS